MAQILLGVKTYVASQLTSPKDGGEQSPGEEHVSAVHGEELPADAQQQPRHHVGGSTDGYYVRYFCLELEDEWLTTEVASL